MNPLDAVEDEAEAEAELGFVVCRRLNVLANVNREDLEHLASLVEEGEIAAAIDRRYSLSEVPDAFRYLGEGHARAKLVVSV